MQALNKAYAASLFLACLMPLAVAAADGAASGVLLRTATIFGVIIGVLLILAAAWYSMLWVLQRLKRTLGM